MENKISDVWLHTAVRACHIYVMVYPNVDTYSVQSKYRKTKTEKKYIGLNGLFFYRIIDNNWLKFEIQCHFYLFKIYSTTFEHRLHMCLEFSEKLVFSFLKEYLVNVLKKML